MTMMPRGTSTPEEEDEEGVVDIDQLVDRYLRTPVTPMQQELLEVDGYVGEVLKQQHTDKQTMLDAKCNNQAAYVDEGGVDDIEVIVESILRGDRLHDVDASLLHRDREGVNAKREEEGVQQEQEMHEQEQQSPLPKRVEKDHIRRRLVRSVSSQRGSESDDPLLRRLMLWQERRDAKRLQAVYEALLQEQAECTFQPQMQASLDSGSNNIDLDSLNRVEQVNGVGGFLHRMAEARSLREQKRREEEEEANRYSDSSTWNPKLTIPKPFELGRKPWRIAPTPASMDTFGRYSASIRIQLQNEPSQIEGPSVPSGLFSVQSSELLLQHVPRRTKTCL